MKLVAFIGRYGHQQFGTIQHMSMRSVRLLAAGINELLSEEQDSVRSRMETDGA